MKKISEPIIFFGSGPVAAKSLQSLYENFNVQFVITKPQPPHHKEIAPVDKFAKEKFLKTYYVRDKEDLKNLFDVEGIINNIRLGVLVDFGIIVPQSVIDRFELGIVNSHFSLLPELRGADPITFAILSGQHTTGVSLMVVVKAMDEGPLLAQEHYTLPANINTPYLTEELIELSNSMLATVVPAYMLGKLSPIEQDQTVTPTYSRKLSKEDGIIDWNKDAEQLEREIRAFAGWPRSHATLNNTKMIITRAHVITSSGTPGQIECINKEFIVHCGNKSLVIDNLTPEGRKEMGGKDFLAGHPLRDS